MNYNTLTGFQNLADKKERKINVHMYFYLFFFMENSREKVKSRDITRISKNNSFHSLTRSSPQPRADPFQ